MQIQDDENHNKTYKTFEKKYIVKSLKNKNIFSLIIGFSFVQLVDSYDSYMIFNANNLWYCDGCVTCVKNISAERDITNIILLFFNIFLKNKL